jgi:hypothetical protein
MYTKDSKGKAHKPGVLKIKENEIHAHVQDFETNKKLNIHRI